MSLELMTTEMEFFTGIASGEGAWKKKVSLRLVRSYKFQHLTVNTAVTVRHNQAVGVFSVIMMRPSTPSAALCLVIDNKQQRGKEISHFLIRRRAQIYGLLTTYAVACARCRQTQKGGRGKHARRIEFLNPWNKQTDPCAAQISCSVPVFAVIF